MARTDTLTNFLTDVAAAIKAVRGDETDIPAPEFDTEILNLTSGSGDDSTLSSTLKGLIERNLTSITIPDGVTNIGNEAFYGYSYLTSITIPDSVKSIGINAFNRCTGLTSITIPDSVTSIGNYAFVWCESLTSITIPDRVTSIGEGVFDFCSGLTSINVSSGNTVYHSSDNCIIEIETKTLISGCKNSIIPSDGSVTSIGNYAFYGRSGLTSITIPDSVMSIGSNAFVNCNNLTEVDLSACSDIPTLESYYAFSNTSDSLVIKVPSALLDEWKAATNWATYADKIVGV